MKLRLIFNYLLILFLFFINCSNEPDLSGYLPGLVNSSNVEDRFSERGSLNGFTAPAIADTNNFSFVVMTDTHYDRSQLGYFKYIEDHKAEWGISFIVVTGDLVQNGDKFSYQLLKDDIAKITLPVYPAIGNHDIYNNGFDYYKKYFGRTVYRIIIGQTELIFLDTANGTLGEGQKAWLESRLENSSCKNKMIFTHYSPIDMEFESPTSMSYPEEAYYIFDLCDRHNVDYYICGHLHAYHNEEIRGTNYIVLSNRAKGTDSLLKVSVENGELKYKILE